LEKGECFEDEDFNSASSHNVGPQSNVDGGKFNELFNFVVKFFELCLMNFLKVFYRF
jgi:hypothetical protein